MLAYGESKLTTLYMLLGMSTMNTSNFEYEQRFDDIKMSTIQFYSSEIVIMIRF